MAAFDLTATPLYKFLHAEHADAVLSGHLLFGSLQYFRLRSYALDDNIIGDKDEGTVRNKVGHLNVAEDPALAASLGWFARGGHATNTTFIRTVDAFVLCLSWGNLEKAQAALSADQCGYDSCVEFASMAKLRDCVWETGLLNGTPMPDLFWFSLGAPVVYRSNEHNVDATQSVAVASPFVKPLAYSDQSEARIALLPRRRISQDKILISVQLAPGLAKLIQFGSTQVRPGLPSSISKDEAISSIRYCAQSLQTTGSRGTNNVAEFERREGPRIRQAYWTLREMGFQSKPMDTFLENRPHRNQGEIVGLPHKLWVYLGSIEKRDNLTRRSLPVASTE